MDITTWPMLISATQVGGHYYVEHVTFRIILGKTTITVIDDKI